MGFLMRLYQGLQGVISISHLLLCVIMQASFRVSKAASLSFQRGPASSGGS